MCVCVWGGGTTLHGPLSPRNDSGWQHACVVLLVSSTNKGQATENRRQPPRFL